MLDWPRRPRIQLVEASPALRAELARAVETSGFEVDALAEVAAPDPANAGQRYALHVIDLAAPGASRWLRDPTTADRSLFLMGETADARAIAREAGRELDVLRKPFSIQALEARIQSRVERLDAAALFRLEPLLQTRDPRLARVFERAYHVARQDCSISIEGELGTGRRALARAIHAASPRAAELLFMLDRGGISERSGDAMEQGVAQLVARAGRGTLLIVEPDDLSARAQTALQGALRACDERGSPRCITLSRVSLDRSAREGNLSTELFYRISGATLSLPPLRARSADQLELCNAIARRVARELGLSSPILDVGIVERLSREGFPGNRPGLESRLRSALIRSEGSDSIATALFDATAVLALSAKPEQRPVSFDLRTLERETIVRALEHSKGNRTHASDALGISVRTLRNKIREYGLP